MKQLIYEEFKKIFGDNQNVKCFFAPGRVNLIGEHTDYNGGHVFPCALTIGTYAAVRLRDDQKLNFYSMNFEKDGVYHSDLNSLVPTKDEGWTAYPKGVIWALKEKGYQIDKGIDMLVFGNIPNSSGLSSSASVEVLTGYVYKSLLNLDISNQDIALVSQYSENKYNGVNCGIMDQFSIAMGQKDSAIFLDTASLKYQYVPVKLSGAKIVIACTNKKRGLGDSKYNERRSECEQALKELRESLDINELGELDEKTFEDNCYLIKSDVRIKRAKHAVYENVRTLKAVDALENGDITLFGRLMNESHISLRDDYEVTGIELDTIVEAAWKQEGVIGARMTGAGFGGCAVALVKDECIDAFVKNVGDIYKEKIGYAADFYTVEIGDGPSEI